MRIATFTKEDSMRIALLTGIAFTLVAATGSIAQEPEEVPLYFGVAIPNDRIPTMDRTL